MSVNRSNIHLVIKRIREALKDLPDPSVTLVGKKWQKPFLVLISCLLSLRTKDETTLPASERLFALAKTPQEMLGLSIANLEKTIYPVGFYRTKAKRIHEISATLIEEFDAKVPDSIEQLLTLKGVGRKTANLVMTEGFGQPAICVDTHVHRISNRFGFVKTKNPLETEESLRRILPRKFWIEYNALLVVWGQNVCRPISPLCSKCCVKGLCLKKGVKTRR